MELDTHLIRLCESHPDLIGISGKHSDAKQTNNSPMAFWRNAAAWQNRWNKEASARFQCSKTLFPCNFGAVLVSFLLHPDISNFPKWQMISLEKQAIQGTALRSLGRLSAFRCADVQCKVDWLPWTSSRDEAFMTWKSWKKRMLRIYMISLCPQHRIRNLVWSLEASKTMSTMMCVLLFNSFFDYFRKKKLQLGHKDSRKKKFSTDYQPRSSQHLFKDPWSSPCHDVNHHLLIKTHLSLVNSTIFNVSLLIPKLVTLRSLWFLGNDFRIQRNAFH